MEYLVRPAVPDDAEGVTNVHLQAWREAYSRVMPDSVFDAREARRAESIQRWRRFIEKLPPNEDKRIFVAESGDRIFGWVTAGVGQEDNEPYPNELEGIYMLAEAHGTGAAKELLEAAVGTDNGAFLWVLKENPRANSFYRKMGFLPDGAEKEFLVGATSLTEIRLVRNPNSGGVEDE
ncbi:MAG: GNAT family N-acetyltransferase [Microbacteriaceae bacterium]|nr:GNAT family N-acetyltransferase [Microbacteriaceae bacterium]